MLNQTCANHPPNVGDSTHTLRGGDTLEVCDGEVGTCGICADKDIVDLNGASSQHRLESLNGQSNAITGNPAENVSRSSDL